MKRYLLSLACLSFLATSCGTKLPESIQGVWYESSSGYGTLVLQFIQNGGKAEVLIDDIALMMRMSEQRGEEILVERLEGFLGKYELQATGENTWGFTVSEGRRVNVIIKSPESIAVDGLMQSPIIDVTQRRESTIEEGMRPRTTIFTKRR